jgi:hypothetical protein
MAIVHIVACWLAMSEKTLLKSKISNSLSLINSLIYLHENPRSWNIIKSSMNEAYIERLYYHRHIKSGNPSSPNKFEMEGLHNHLSYPILRKQKRSLHTCAQDVQITHTITI